MKSTIVSLLQPISRMFTMAPGDVTPEFPLGVLDVAIWAEVLREFYMEGSKRGALGRQRMDKLRVEELRRYKERSASEHEYIVTKVRSGEGSQYQYLRFERNIRSPSPTPTNESSNSIASIFTNSDTASVSSTSSLSSILNPPAIDTVTPLASWPLVKKKGPEGLRLIEKIKFGGNYPTLLDLALIAEITHEHSKEYRLFKRQCFWYANVISRTLQKKAPSTIERVDKDAEFDEVQNEAAGTWKRFRVLDVLPKQTMAVWESVQTMKPALQKKIYEAGKNWEEMVQRAADYSTQKRLKEEAVRREELARNMEEDARRREEDARKRERGALAEREDAQKREEGARKREEAARKREQDALAERENARKREEDALIKQDDLLRKQADLIRQREDALQREQSLRREIEELRRLVMMTQTSKA